MSVQKLRTEIQRLCMSVRRLCTQDIFIIYAIERLAQKNKWTYDETVRLLAQQYDGYHFTWPSPDIFNPFSLLNAFARNRIENYWFASGTPTFLIEMLRRFNVVPSKIGCGSVQAKSFDAPTENLRNIIPLLYQSGYLTIKGYNARRNTYLLEYLNEDVRTGMTSAPQKTTI